MKKLKRLFSIARKLILLGGNEVGIALIDTLVALAILGIVAAVFLSGLATTARANSIVDEQATAKSLAWSQMEYAKTVGYVYEATQYTTAPIPANEDYANYSVSIYAEPLNNPDDGIQKITVSVKHDDKEAIALEGYKVD